MSRLDDCSDKDERKRRVDEVALLGLKFHDSYVLAFGLRCFSCDTICACMSSPCTSNNRSP
jgi:hypothetical protein